MNVLNNTGPNTERVFTFEEISTAEIDAVGNYRKHFDAAEDERLLADVAAHGFRHPFPVVRDPATGRYRLFGAFRRFTVARKLGKDIVPCLVYLRELTEAELALENLRDNCFRTNPDPVDEAFGLLRAKQLNGLNQRELAVLVGKSESTVSKLLAITELPAKVHDLIRAGKLTVETSYKLASLRDETVFEALLESAVTKPGSLSLPAKRKPRTQTIRFAGITMSVPAEANAVRYVTDAARKLLAALKVLRDSGEVPADLATWLKSQDGSGHEAAI